MWWLLKLRHVHCIPIYNITMIFRCLHPSVPNGQPICEIIIIISYRSTDAESIHFGSSCFMHIYPGWYQRATDLHAHDVRVGWAIFFTCEFCFQWTFFFVIIFFSLCVWGTSRLPNRMGDHYFFTHVDIINNYYKIIIIKSRFWCRLLLMFRFSSWHDGTKWYNRQQTNLPPCLAHSK